MRTAAQAWVLYDADCSLCVATVRRFGVWFRFLGYRRAPLQMAWVARRLGLPRDELLRAVRVIAVDGSHSEGIDAIIRLLAAHPATWPASALLRLPGVHGLGRRAYHWVSTHRELVAARLPFVRTGAACRMPREWHP